MKAAVSQDERLVCKELESGKLMEPLGTEYKEKAITKNESSRITKTLQSETPPKKQTAMTNCYKTVNRNV